VTEYTHPILIKGRYQVVALTPDADYDPGEITAYAVYNSSGAKLRHELSLDDAKAWVEQMIEEENLQRPDQPTPAKTTRTKPTRIRR
jgi:hypothetical protein